MKALKEKQKIDLAKMELKMKEEELELKTEMEISQAKSKVLQDYFSDRGSVKSERSLQPHDPYVPVPVNEDVNEHFNTERKRYLPDNINLPLQEDFNQHLSPQTTAASGENLIQCVVQQLRKPPPEIMKFSGDPIEYQRFKRQFKVKIVVNSETEDEKMSYLEQFTLDEVLKIVKGYSYLEASQGYQKAWQELDERYGNEDAIASAIVKKALGWPNVKVDNPKSMDEYAIFLQECENAVSSITAVKILEYPDNIRRLVMKLPFHCHEKWRNIVISIRDSGGTVAFHNLVKFVKREARKATDPMYGKDALRNDDRTKTQPKRNAGIASQSSFKPSFSTDMVENTTQNTQSSKPEGQQILCIYCNSNSHKLQICDQIVKKTLKDRLAFLQKRGLCFRCLCYGHLSKSCEKTVTCFRCNRNHQGILHVVYETERKLVGACTEQDGTCEAMEAGAMECTLAIIPVKVSYSNGVKVESTYAFLDPGSTVSFCSESLLKKLGCSGKSMDITIDTMGKPYTTSVQTVNGLQVHDLDLRNTIALPTVYSKEHIPVLKKHIPVSSDVQKWPHLNDIYLPEIDASVDILIGGNVPDSYAPLEIRTGPDGSPHATRTKLGWILWNVLRLAKENRFPSMRTDITIKAMEDLQNINTMMKNSMNYDFPEKAAEERKEMSQEDKEFMKIVTNSIHKEDGHYVVNLPFRDKDVIMPDNSEQALQRLRGLKKKFTMNPQIHKDYKKFMEDILSKEYAEIVPQDELKGKPGKVWFIPHHGVYHPRKQGKIRVVFDCSATFQGVSLNSSLLQGPNLCNSLLGVLMRYRQENIAFMGDIESMYYRVRVPKEDNDFLRFYWWPDGDCRKEPKVYRMLVHIFGAVSSASCASFALQQTARDSQDKFVPEIIEKLTDNVYVDDCLASELNEEKAVSTVKELTSLCSEGSFRLTKWISNSSTVMKSIPPQERAKDVKDLNLDCEDLPSERALGVYWFVQSDTLGFKIKSKMKPDTKRGILSVVSSVYDPLGLMAPFILISKQLLQNLHKEQKDWDEDVDSKTQKIWHQWLKDLTLLEDIHIPRCYKPMEFGLVTSCQLHLFADASNVGYGVVGYIRFVNEDEEIHCALVMSKSRVAPLKKITIPRMELTAATLAVRMSSLILQELQVKVDTTFFWTDSMSVLRCIFNTNARFKTFVANRIAVIRDCSDIDQWRYVSSKENPADYASRGIKLDNEHHIQHWTGGPRFLWQHHKYWPKQYSNQEPQEDDLELKECVHATIMEKDSFLDFLINHFSSWTKLRRAVAWIMLTIRCLRQRVNKSQSTKKVNYTMNVQVLEDAEKLLVQHCQTQHFSKEQRCLKQSSATVDKSSPLYKLDPFLQDNVIHVGGRLKNAEISFSEKHPIILPKKSRVTCLIIEETHKIVGHLGKNSILSHLRQWYWVIGAGSLVKTIVSKCVTCRKYHSSPGQQKMSDLPDERITPDLPPFTNVGMDFFGPFKVIRGRTSVKRYGVVFTCMNLRAIHLEAAATLDTDSCIHAIRRFVARRGPPKFIKSDNGTNLVGCQRELCEALKNLKESKIHSAFVDKGIEWSFNPPAASHYGGFWERMIRTVRKVLHCLLQEQNIKLDDEALNTLFCEVESIINGRPITDLSYDVHDLSVLTPNHLLYLRSGEKMPPGTFKKEDIYSRRRWKQVQYLADIFWKRWKKEYLPLLQQKQKWNQIKRNLQIGDIVLIMDNTPRNAWALARVTELYHDRKNLVRTVKVKTASSEFVRPVDKLCLVMEDN
ncbi:uncharacterized protein LOC124121032 [Haliotis rufescens]|uniref:uncharacterized protein LOC124121032 n=1 Tax=Haliotis rufescens TaxID=6454 RepID=UPI00201F4A05|nr:uncharacterized protein LOC124121032 [Haliotis rufescens]